MVFRTKTEEAVKRLDKKEWVLAFVKSVVLELGQVCTIDFRLY